MSLEQSLQYLTDDKGKAVAVVVPIDVWREIESERETAYLLKSDAMRKRLLEAKDRLANKVGRVLNAERDESMAGICQGLADVKVKRLQPLAQTFADLRDEFGETNRR